MSSIPAESNKTIDTAVPYCMGIDEAGRGPVLGPMVYGCCYCPIPMKKTVERMGFADSKTLTEAQRDSLFNKISTPSNPLHYAVACLSPEELSHKMLRIHKYNLNAISHDTAISLINKVLSFGVKLQEVYIDTVGDPGKYQGRLKNLFPQIDEIVVSKKADSIYPIVSAASICAKVTRDHHLKNWEFVENNVNLSRVFGSGYPGDPVTKKWLKISLDPVFGYPSIIRFSWKTCSNLLEAGAVPVTWKEDDDEEPEEYYWHKSRSPAPSKSPKTPTNKPNKLQKTSAFVKDRFRYFSDNNMDVVTDF